MSAMGARLDRLPFSPFHRNLLLLIGFGMFFDAYDLYMASSVLAELVHIHWSTPAMNAVFLSVGFAGLFVGALLSGFVGDRFGRKFMYQFNLLVFGIASLVAAISPNFTFLVVMRFIMGIGLGGEIVTGYATFSEFMPAESRGRWQSVLSFITNLGQPLSAAIALAVIPNIGWRWMFVIAGVPALVVWWLRRTIPESPRWLEEHGDTEKAEAVMTEIERRARIQPASVPVVSQTSVVQKQEGFGQLFSHGLLTRTILACLLLMIMNAAVYGFTSWVPTIFVGAGYSITKTLTFNVLMLIGAPVGSIIGALLSDSAGRKWTMVVMSVVGAIFGIFYGQMHSEIGIVVMGFLTVADIYALVAMTFGIYVPELFPTNVRLRGTGLANAMGRLSSALVPYGVVVLLSGVGPMGVFAAVAGIMVVQAISMAIFGIETSKKSLEEIAKTPDNETIVIPNSVGVDPEGR